MGNTMRSRSTLRRGSLDAAEAQLATAIDQAWTRNWLSSELVTTQRRTDVRLGLGVLRAGLRAARRRHPAARDDRWVTDHEHATADAANGLDSLVRSGHDERGVIAEARRCATLVSLLPATVDVTTRRTAQVATGADERMLERVRALLAKAEATTFDGEADAFTSKAHQLMAKHSIAHAMLVDPEGAAAAAMRIWHERPYVSAKSTLLARVAHGLGCRVVVHSGLECSTVFGMGPDLDAVEVLYTSLLLQAAAELRLVEARGEDDRARRRSFRNAFHMGFADRIGLRLDEVRLAAQAEASGDEPGVLPVLVRRDERVDEALQAAFPQLGRARSRSVSNGAGYAAGGVAGSRADIGPGGSSITRSR